jgi:nucleoside permease NupC
VIIFFASLVSILYYLGIMQRIVQWVGGAIGWVTGIGRVEALGSAANIFVGQSESPLVVRPYLAALTPPQLFTLMAVGMAASPAPSWPLMRACSARNICRSCSPPHSCRRRAAFSWPRS